GAMGCGGVDGAGVRALGVVRAGSRLRLQASVVGPAGTGVSGLRVSFSVRHSGGASRGDGEPCGDGCYEATAPVSGRPLQVEVQVARGGATTRWSVAMPAAWPPPDGRAILERADRVWRGLRTLAYTDRLGSDERHVVHTR